MAEPWPSRFDRPVAGPLVHVRLEAQVARLEPEERWRMARRDAITLVKEPAHRRP